MSISFSKLLNGRGCKYCGRERTIAARKTKLDIDEAKILCQKNNFEFINLKNENHVIYIYFVCNKHKELGIQKMRKTNMLRDIKGCKYCKGDLPEWYVKQKIKNEYPLIETIGEYKNLSTPMQCLCKKHNILWKIAPNQILRGVGCVECGKEKVSKFRLHTQQEYERIIKLVNPDVQIISQYQGLEEDITVKCKKCGYIWTLNANSLKINGTRCRKCSYTYKGEDKVIEILKSIGCDYIHQYKFDDCKDKRKLLFDFYLPQYNLCIEFDGKQHFEPRFGINSYNETVKHDKIKNNYCMQHGIRLLRIPYWESNNMKDIIIRELNNKVN